MSDILPTVKIKHPSGSCIINASDFDPKIHTLFDAKPEPQQGAVKFEGLDAKALRKTARGLGVTFGPRTSDAKLISDINAAKGA
jgi:hypothetical protein